MSDRTEVIHPTGRHTNKASASSTCFSGLLWVFVRQPGFDSSTLHDHQHPHRHLVECGFQWDWFYIESAFITAPKMTALLEGVCRVTLEEEQRRIWATHQLLDPLLTPLALSLSQLELQSAGCAAEIPGGPGPTMLCEMTYR